MKHQALGLVAGDIPNMSGRPALLDYAVVNQRKAQTDSCVTCTESMSTSS